LKKLDHIKKKDRLTQAEFRTMMGFDIKSKPACMNDIADAIREFAEDLRGKVDDCRTTN